MRYIFVDFEMNPAVKSNLPEGAQCGYEIIEIGAVMLDEDYKEIDSYKSYVKPMYNNAIGRKYKELTGIDSNMIAGVHTFERAYKKFMDWFGSNDYEIYAWSSSDSIQVKKEMQTKNFTFDENVEYMFSHWFDFQKMFDEIAGSDQQLSLEKALNICGISFDGKKHDALNDARNTSRLFAESKLNDLSGCIKTIQSYSGNNDDAVTLGDLFNFALIDTGD